MTSPAPWLLFLTVVSLGCSRTDPEIRPEQAASASAKATATATPPPGASPLVLARGVRIEKARAGVDAATLVRAALERERKDGRELLVYVGATWCEPCQRFHDAAAAGKLDDAFPSLTVLEFDLDADKERLAGAGYTSDMIPLFAKPNPDGRASEKRFSGSVKGDGAVSNIAPRLRRLLAE